MMMMHKINTAEARDKNHLNYNILTTQYASYTN